MLTDCPLGKKEPHACWECLFNSQRESNIAFQSINKCCTHPDYGKVKLNNPESKPEPAGGLLGWVCPKCGAALSPFVNYCVKCSGNLEITYSTGNAPQVGFYQTESNYNREQRESGD